MVQKIFLTLLTFSVAPSFVSHIFQRLAHMQIMFDRVILSKVVSIVIAALILIYLELLVHLSLTKQIISYIPGLRVLLMNILINKTIYY